MRAWSTLTANQGRGAGGRSMAMEFPGSEISCHMSMFPPRTYKKAHRHDGHAEKIEDRARDQIEYVDEDPAVRERFEAELSTRGLSSVIPRAPYAERDYEWTPVPV